MHETMAGRARIIGVLAGRSEEVGGWSEAGGRPSMERGVGGGHGHLAVELLHLLVGSLYELLSTRIRHDGHKKALFFASMCPVHTTFCRSTSLRRLARVKLAISI